MPVQNIRLKVAALLAFVVVSGGLLLMLYLKAGGRLPASSPAYEVTAVMPSAQTLAAASKVRAAGISVGTVQDIERNARGEAVIRFSLDDEFAPLSRDARVRIGLKSALGESYLDIEPGSGRAGWVPNHGRIDVRQLDDSVQLDELLSAFDARTRRDLRGSLAAVYGGLEKRGGDLNTALGAAEPTVRDGATVMNVLADQRDQTARVVRNTSALLETLSDRSDSLERFVRQGRNFAVAITSRDRALASTIRALPPALAEAKALAARAGALGDVASPVLADLTKGATALTPAVQELGPAAAGGRALLDRVPRLSGKLNPLLSGLRKFSAATPPLLAALPPTLQELNPALAVLSTYSRDFGGFFANVGMANDEFDEFGRSYVRAYAIISAAANRIGEGLTQDGADAVLKALGIDKSYRTPDFNPYPAPNTADKPQPFDGKYPGIEPGK